MDPDGPDGGKKKKSSRPLFLNRDIVIKRLHHRQQSKKASPMVLLKDIFEETPDKDRFVGDVMFWKFFEDIDANRIYHTNSVEYRNLKVMFFETLFYLVLLGSVTAYAYNLQSQDVFESRIEQLDYWKGCDTDGNCRIQKVEDVASFWTWMQNELVPLAYTDDVDAPKVAQIETVFENSEFPLYWSSMGCKLIVMSSCWISSLLPGKLTAGSPENHLFEKGNHLNQTFMTLGCLAATFQGWSYATELQKALWWARKSK